MSKQLPNPLNAWLSQVASLAVTLRGDEVHRADSNMLVFSLSDAKACGVSPEQLDQFLMQAYRHFSRVLASSGSRACFYAWHDEMSGTLRTGIVPVDGELPFACRVNVVDSPAPVSAGALSSPYSDGIPTGELETEHEWQDEDEGPEFVLTVFARPLMAQA